MGVLTDKDLRRRVLGVGQDTALPVSTVMTPKPKTIAAEMPIMAALLLMQEMHIHHLPVAEAGSIRPESAADLRDCFEFIRDVRFRHQIAQIKAGQPASSKLDPKHLSRFDREHLPDAFKITRAQLDNLRSAMAGGLT